MIQRHDIRAGADVVFGRNHDMGVPRSALLTFKDAQPVQIQFRKNIGGDGFEPALKLLPVGEVVPHGHRLQSDTLKAISPHHPFNPQPDGKRLLFEMRRQRLRHYIRGFLFLGGFDGHCAGLIAILSQFGGAQIHVIENIGPVAHQAA